MRTVKQIERTINGVRVVLFHCCPDEIQLPIKPVTTEQDRSQDWLRLFIPTRITSDIWWDPAL